MTKRTQHADKVVAYVERQVGDEILELEAVNVLPRRGQPVTVGKDKYTVYDVRTVNDPVFDAVVEVDRS